MASDLTGAYPEPMLQVTQTHLTSRKLLISGPNVPQYESAHAPYESFATKAEKVRLNVLELRPMPRNSNFLDLGSDFVITTLATCPPRRKQRRLSGPVQLLGRILKIWRLKESHATTLLGLDPSDEGYVLDVLAGRELLKGRDANDRLAYLVQIRMTLSAWLRSDAAESDWLREPQVMLDNRAPMSLLLEGSMENLLLVKEYVEAVTGW